MLGGASAAVRTAAPRVPVFRARQRLQGHSARAEPLPRAPTAFPSFSFSSSSSSSASCPGSMDGFDPRAYDVVLGTRSPSRRRVMDGVCASFPGLAYACEAADIDEDAIGDRLGSPSTLVLALAKAKAEALLSRRSDWSATSAAAVAAARTDERSHPKRPTLLVTCDQVVVSGSGEILEKPRTADEARRWIRGYAEAAPRTVGSVRVTNLATGRVAEGVDTVTITFRPTLADAADALVADGACLGCAGGLMVEHPLVAPHLEGIDGEQDSVMGLSPKLLLTLLREATLPP